MAQEKSESISGVFLSNMEPTEENIASIQQESIDKSQTKQIETRVKELLSQPISEYGFREYKRSLKTHIMTSRFADHTYIQNKRFRSLKNIKKQKIHAIYASPYEITADIPKGHILYVLEMNNSQNKIMGIGKVYNVPRRRENLVYDINNTGPYSFVTDYNKITYTGDERVDVEVMDEEEKRYIHMLEMLCFKGKDNLKRSQRITQFPLRRSYQLRNDFNLHEIIETIFENHPPKSSI
tara:strand:+ start:55 stop:768 length:714 start_codon:yes stop_codon:yes gene_type:complete